jgi:hypothetical protein
MIQGFANQDSFSAGCHLPKGEKCLRGFIYSAGIILLITALAKLLSAGGSSRILLQSDPIFKIPFRSLLTIVGVFELAVATFCLFGKPLRAQAAIVAWVATNFVLYRASLLWIGYHSPCACLGQLTDTLHISGRIADTFMKFILAYLIFGSYATLLWLKLQGRGTQTLKTAISITRTDE